MPELENPPCCPGEDDCPAGAPGAVEHRETIARFIPDINWLAWDDDGKATVSTSAFSKTELNSKDSKKSSCSLARSDLIPSEKIFERADSRNVFQDWEGDPVLAYAKTENIRSIFDDFGRREACVYANPLEGFPEHAFLRRGEPPLDGKRRMEWAIFRRRVALEFDKVQHHSGSSVSKPQLAAPSETDRSPT